MDKLQQRSWLAWASVGVLAALCASLALLQNHWIAELSHAERVRLQQQLQSELGHLSREFNNEITAACAGLMPSLTETEELGLEKAYANRYAQWRQSHDRIFSRIALAIPHDSGLDLASLDREKGEFSPVAWPDEWSAARQELMARLNHTGLVAAGPSNVIMLPQFGGGRGLSGPGPGPHEQGWLVVEVNLDYVRGTMLPELLHRYLAAGGKLDYQAEVVESVNPSKVIFQSAAGTNDRILSSHDASVPLFDVNIAEILRPRQQQLRGFYPGSRPGGPGGPGGPRRGPPPGPQPSGGMPGRPGFGPPPGGPGGRDMQGPPPTDRGPARWQLLVRHQAGSLEAVVSRARWQNLATSLGILLLILATITALVRFSRRAQRLADLQMNFVAGVSHELRTPLTVIRTAAFNLRGKIAAKPEQVERYGALIHDESEKLEALVEQVLRFSSARAGHAIRAREPVAIEAVIEEGLRSSSAAIAGSKCFVEKQIESGLPLVLVDQLAMRHAFQNLVENALKYGTEGSNWIGVFASRASNKNGAGAIEIRVADHGPGIPEDEQEQIFDPFFRGRRALEDQVHGTGLGLNLVKQIVEAHGGTIRVKSDPAGGTEFVMLIPAAPLESQG
jgi:signal transduction histidine kinase